MRLYQQYATENECYKVGRKHTPRGIMVHSTGVNNPYLKRYVQPDDGRLGVNPYNNSFNTFHPNGYQVCPHAFIGKLADESIATYQTLPWDVIGWHSGQGYAGNANFMGYIGFEICEDDLQDSVYFNAVYREAVELCAYLCKKYDINPLESIICHSEGYAKGIASNHSDITHWLPIHNKTMGDFRADVNAQMNDYLFMSTLEKVETVKPSAKEDVIYTVKYGDTLSAIARDYGTTYQKIAEYNGIANPNIIRVGQQIKIPTNTTHTLQPENTPKKSVDDIAREVIRGLWGNGAKRKKQLTDAGYDYTTIQKRVNDILS